MKKHYRFLMYELCNKLVCLSKPVKVIVNREDTGLLRNQGIMFENFLYVILY